MYSLCNQSASFFYKIIKIIKIINIFESLA